MAILAFGSSVVKKDVCRNDIALSLVPPSSSCVCAYIALRLPGWLKMIEVKGTLADRYLLELGQLHLSLVFQSMLVYSFPSVRHSSRRQSMKNPSPGIFDALIVQSCPTKVLGLSHLIWT